MFNKCFINLEEVDPSDSFYGHIESLVGDEAETPALKEEENKAVFATIHFISKAREKRNKREQNRKAA